MTKQIVEERQLEYKVPSKTSLCPLGLTTFKKGRSSHVREIATHHTSKHSFPLLQSISGCYFWMTLMDIWVIWGFLLDVVQATGVWFQDGRVMEHLVECDAQEYHIELRDNREREGDRGGWRLDESYFTSTHSKIRALCSTKLRRRSHTRFPTLPNRAQNLLKQTKQGTVRQDSCILLWRSLSMWLIHTCLIIFTLRGNLRE